LGERIDKFNDQSFLKVKQIQNSIPEEDFNNDKSTSHDKNYHSTDKNLVAKDINNGIYCSPDIDMAIADTSMGGDIADIVCESRSVH
jgi:hypothetical protein